MSYFSQLIEGYYYINIIPEGRILGLPDYVYFYAAILIGLAVILILAGVLSLRRHGKINVANLFLCFILVVWLFTSLQWAVTQSRWLKNDLTDYSNKSMAMRRTQALAKIIQSIHLPENWHDFYVFLEFSRQQIPQEATVYLLPADNTFQTWAKYWFYPDLNLIASLPADYILVFNVNLDGVPDGYKIFKEFAPNKYILIRIELSS